MIDQISIMRWVWWLLILVWCQRCCNNNDYSTSVQCEQCTGFIDMRTFFQVRSSSRYKFFTLQAFHATSLRCKFTLQVYVASLKLVILKLLSFKLFFLSLKLWNLKLSRFKLLRFKLEASYQVTKLQLWHETEFTRRFTRSFHTKFSHEVSHEVYTKFSRSFHKKFTKFSQSLHKVHKVFKVTSCKLQLTSDSLQVTHLQIYRSEALHRFYKFLRLQIQGYKFQGCKF